MFKREDFNIIHEKNRGFFIFVQKLFVFKFFRRSLSKRIVHNTLCILGSPFSCSSNEYDIILISDKIWTSKILLNNLYTFIIKCLSYTLNSNTESLLNDLEYTFNIMDTNTNCIERDYFKNLTKNTKSLE